MTFRCSTTTASAALAAGSTTTGIQGCHADLQVSRHSTSVPQPPYLDNQTCTSHSVHLRLHISTYHSLEMTSTNVLFVFMHRLFGTHYLCLLSIVTCSRFINQGSIHSSSIKLLTNMTYLRPRPPKLWPYRAVQMALLIFMNKMSKQFDSFWTIIYPFHSSSPLQFRSKMFS